MITIGTKCVISKGSTRMGLVKGTTLRVTQIDELGPEYSHAVRVWFEILNSFSTRNGVPFGTRKALTARHKNRLNDPFTRLNTGDPTNNIEIKAVP